MSRTLVASLLVSAVALAPLPVGAEDRRIDEALTVTSDDACLGADALARSVQTWLRRDRVDVRLSVLVETSAGAGSITVLADARPTAVRRFEELPAACADRRAVLGLAVAIAIDAALVDRLVPAATPALAAATSGEPEERTSPAVADAPPDPPSATGALGMEGGLALGLFPDAVARVSIAGALTVGALVTISIAGDVTSPFLRSLGSGELEAMIASGRAQACLTRGEPTLELAGCLQFSAGALLARGRGYARTFDVALPWLSAGARVEAVLWLGPDVGLSLGVEALVPFPSQHLDVTSTDGAVLASLVLPPAAVVIASGLRFRIAP